MHPDKQIFHTYRRLEGLSKRPDDSNTLTFQYFDTNNAPRDLLLGLTRPSLRLPLRPHLQSCAVSQYSQIANTLPLHQYPAHCLVLLAAAFPVISISSFTQLMFTTRFDSSFSTGFDSGFPDSIRINVFNRIQLRFYQLDLNQCF